MGIKFAPHKIEMLFLAGLNLVSNTAFGKESFDVLSLSP
jgi:hypothetical protein